MKKQQGDTRRGTDDLDRARWSRAEPAPPTPRGHFADEGAEHVHAADEDELEEDMEGGYDLRFGGGRPLQSERPDGADSRWGQPRPRGR